MRMYIDGLFSVMFHRNSGDFVVAGKDLIL